MHAALPHGDGRLTTLVHLSRRARAAASTLELGFIGVNETHNLAPYRQAALWLYDGYRSSGKLAAISGVATIEGNAPYVTWLGKLFKALPVDGSEPVRGHLYPNQLKAELQNEWADWLPGNWVLVALPQVGRFKGGALLIARDEAWREEEIQLLVEWGAILAQAYALQSGQSWLTGTAAGSGTAGQAGRPAGGHAAGRLYWILRRAVWPLLAVAVGVLSFMPVQLTVLAPAELVPLNPTLVRAPMDGVVDKILVQPNQKVKAGEPLFEFDSVNLESKTKIAASALATSQAEYRNRAQRALFEPESKAQLAIIQGQIEERRAELDYLRSLKGRSLVSSPQAGVVLFSDASDWVGKPVVTGERVMTLADPKAVEIEAWLSPGDAVPIALGSPVELYLNADPLTPLQARLRYIAHEAIARPDGNYAYRVRADLLPGQEGRIGLKGSARLQSDSVSLGYWVFRRPLAQARAWLGL